MSSVRTRSFIPRLRRAGSMSHSPIHRFQHPHCHYRQFCPRRPFSVRLSRSCYTVNPLFPLEFFYAKADAMFCLQFDSALRVAHSLFTSRVMLDIKSSTNYTARTDTQPEGRIEPANGFSSQTSEPVFETSMAP
jgi:hypothetical protein